MSRPPTKQLTLQFVLRTLARMQMVTRLNDKLTAKVLLPHLNRTEVRHIAGLGQFLLEIGEYLEEEKQAAGIPEYPYTHGGKCLACGKEISRDHNGAKYCTDRCRQRAYRKRLKRSPVKN